MSEKRVIAGRFHILDVDRDLLGRGGMGEVYRATDIQTGDTVAIKVLDPEVLARNPNILERFQREGETLRQLNHPNITRFVTSVEEDECHYLVMEYVAGGSLDDLLAKEGRLPASRAVEIALDLADALTRAHRMGILHRDLKPANILFAEDGTPRLADFGIAYRYSVERLTQTGVLVGTVDYLSPEVCQGKPPDEKSDIWSFGILLFEILTGQLPFRGESLTAKITAILVQPVPDIAQLSPEIPDALADLVYRMLQKDPLQRIPSVRQVGAELEVLLKGCAPATPAPADSRFTTPTPPAAGQWHVQVPPNLTAQPGLLEERKKDQPPSVGTSLPIGTVTFLFTDIQGSTPLWEREPEKMTVALQVHNIALRRAIEANGGVVIEAFADSFQAAFATAPQALKAAIEGQKALQSASWNELGPLKVRIGLHTGEAEISPEGNEYLVSHTKNRASRIMSAAHGGQILLSGETADLVMRKLPEGVILKDMGEHRLKGMQWLEHLYQVLAPGLTQDFPPLATGITHPQNLPVQTTLFVGRKTELNDLARLLNDPIVRLVTIVGLGGIGKTRLAIEAGARQLEHFTHGVYFVSLAGLETVEAIVPATAQALGFSFYEGREPRQQLLDYLSEKKILLIYDNFEHLIAAPKPGQEDGASLVEDILHSTKDVLVLCTSRIRLGVLEEHLFHLAGMDFPDREIPANVLEYGAVQLFLQSARRVRPDFELAADDLKYVARICCLVGGTPLGIMLAVAWLEILTPAEIAAEIQDSLDFLTTDLTGVDARQRSLRAVLDYSWNLLTEQERVVFRGLSVFRGGFTREAVQNVTGAGLRELMGLVSKSLVSRTPTGRYDVHELLRQYAAEKLAKEPEEEQAARDRHCAYYAELLSQKEVYLFGKNQRSALAEIGAEVDNVRAGWDWAVAQCNLQRIDQYLESLGELYQTRGWYQEGVSLLSKASHRLSVSTEGVADLAARLLLGKVLLRQGRLSESFDVSAKTDQLFEASISIFRAIDARKELAYALFYRGGCESPYGWSSEAPCQEGMGILQELGDQRGTGLGLRGLAWVALHHGNYPLAKQQFTDSLALFRELDDLKEVARSMRGLGYTTWIQGQYQEARQYHQEMLSLCQELGHQGGIARSLGDLGIDAIGLREVKEAYRLLYESLAIFREIGDPQGMADELGDLGELANSIGDYASATRFAQESHAHWAKVFDHPVGWTLRVLGNAACGLGDLPQARRYLFQALDWAIRNERRGHILLTLVGIASLAAKQGDKKRALELLILVLQHPSSWQWAKDNAMKLVIELETELPPEVIEFARERSQALSLEATVDELISD